MVLHEYLEVDTSLPSGLRWKIAPSKRVRAGVPAFTSIGQGGYMRGMLNRKHYQTHRVVFYLTHGYMPEQVDHIDGNRLNNTPANLRAATSAMNNQNKVCRGFYKDGRGKFVAQIKLDGKSTTLGVFDDSHSARACYLEAKRKHHPTAPERCYGGVI